jgi:hypothetical protein
MLKNNDSDSDKKFKTGENKIHKIAVAVSTIGNSNSGQIQKSE